MTPTQLSPAEVPSPLPRDVAVAWDAVLTLRRRARAAPLAFPQELTLDDETLTVAADGGWRLTAEPAPAVAALLDLYLPLAAVPHRRGFVLAHLAQSLDGRIATSAGVSQWLTGEADLLHTHRLRALADAVIVGSGTVHHDDPRLTVRHCAGDQPVRVVLDPRLGLPPERHVFRDGATQTLVLAAADRVGGAARLGAAEVVGLPSTGEGLAPAAVRAALAARGLYWLFVEGGGVTVSRFLAARALDRLQIAVAPVILGSGRPGLTLPEIADLGAALRPRMRRFALGADMLLECILHD
jgi:riboflavin-specific deaminase-like protein